ncbi:MAG: tannase/feruloyl esterase family alpha/beta hydrolase [Pseudomonadota bacterium]
MKSVPSIMTSRRVTSLLACLVACLFAAPGHADTVPNIDAARLPAPADGWAGAAGGTAGGAAATSAAIYTVSNRAQLLNALRNGDNGAKIIKLTGTIDMSGGVPYSSRDDQAARGTIKINSNTTLIGDGAASGIVNGQLVLNGVSQVIIRNLKIVNPCDVAPSWDPATGAWNGTFPAVTIAGSHHVWIDHTSFTDAPGTDNLAPMVNGVRMQCHGGALAVSHGADYVTVSYTVFAQQASAAVIGTGDDADAGHLRVTFSNNVFNAVSSAAPLARQGQLHLFNNYYVGTRDDAVYPHRYSVGAGLGAQILSNNNAFEIAGAPGCDALLQDPDAGPAGAVKDSGSMLNGRALAGCALPATIGWSAPYAYSARPLVLVKANALAQAGAGKLTTTITGTGSTDTMLAGVVMDGYLSGARVFFDINDNGQFDAGEASTMTDTSGKFILAVPSGQALNHALVAQVIAGSTVDLDQPGKPVSLGYSMTAPVGVTNVLSPLTTLVAARMAGGQTLQQALASLRAALGLPDDADLLADYLQGPGQSALLHNYAVATAVMLQSAGAGLPANATAADRAAAVVTKFGVQVAGYAGTIGAAADPAAAAAAASYVVNFQPAPLTAAGCAALNGTALPASAFSLATGGAVITSATWVPASAPDNFNGTFCKVLGNIDPASATGNVALGAVTVNPPIGFEVNLPAQWNGKFIHNGGGGFDGTLDNGSSGVPGTNGMARLNFAPATAATPLALGYMTFGSDSGHQSSSITSGTFAANDEALANYGRLQLKKTQDAARYLMQSVYRVPRQLKGYFFGSSTGGRDGFAVIQNWPENYDGLFINRPALNYTGLRLANVALGRALWLNAAGAASPAGWINPVKTTLLMQTVMNTCDGLDGLEDGIISNLDGCKARSDTTLATLRCAGGGDTGNNCLSDAQIATVRTMANPLVFDYALANGVTRYGGYNIMAGMVFGGAAVTNCAVPANNIPAYGSPYASRDFGPSATGPVLSSTGQFSTLFSNWCATASGGAAANSPNAYQTGSEWVKYFIARQSQNFDPRRMNPANGNYAGTPAAVKSGTTYAATPATAYAQRIAEVSAMTDATNPDLDAFIAKGGKIVWTHGSADEVVSTDSSVDYYHDLVARYGQHGVDGFTRFYIINGLGHGDTGPFIPVYDPLQILTDWAERNIDPADHIVIPNRNAKSPLDRTAGGTGQRPLCRYPSWPRYEGGDANLASSFSCAGN